MSSSQSLVCEINRGNGELKIKPKCKKLATLIQETNTRRMHPVLGNILIASCDWNISTFAFFLLIQLVHRGYVTVIPLGSYNIVCKLTENMCRSFISLWSRPWLDKFTGDVSGVWFSQLNRMLLECLEHNMDILSWTAVVGLIVVEQITYKVNK